MPTRQSPFNAFFNPFGASNLAGFDIPLFSTDTIQKWFAGLPGMEDVTPREKHPDFPRVPPDKLMSLSSQYTLELTQLWQNVLMASIPALEDPRFSGPAWQQPGYGSIAALYLLNARFIMHLADALTGDAKTCTRIRFCVEQWVAASAPNNYLGTNPKALEQIEKTGGESLRRGMENFWADLARGRISQTDEDAFVVGRDVAQTPGDVVYENDLIQVIQYTPTTQKVHETPLLIVPPHWSRLKKQGVKGCDAAWTTSGQRSPVGEFPRAMKMPLLLAAT